MDMFYRIKTASDEERRLVLILPNPAHGYLKVAMLINKFKVSCKNLYIFIMDEYADQDGNVAPESYPQGFMRALKSYFYYRINDDLRPPEDNIKGPTTKNIKDYGKMISDLGGADACYSGPGWTGHLAFIEPDAPEFEAELEQWKKMGPRIVTLSPITIAQNSLHGSFGFSGDLAMVPPKAATIGPAEVISSKYRMDMHALKIYGTPISWQRMISRLCLHGPVTPKLPTSIHQILKSDIILSETIAQDIKADWEFGY
jgi:glucosamine-6-phosphate deaminase